MYLSLDETQLQFKVGVRRVSCIVFLAVETFCEMLDLESGQVNDQQHQQGTAAGTRMHRTVKMLNHQMDPR